METLKAFRSFAVLTKAFIFQQSKRMATCNFLSTPERTYINEGYSDKTTESYTAQHNLAIVVNVARDLHSFSGVL